MDENTKMASIGHENRQNNPKWQKKIINKQWQNNGKIQDHGQGKIWFFDK